MRIITTPITSVKVTFSAWLFTFVLIQIYLRHPSAAQYIKYGLEDLKYSKNGGNFGSNGGGGGGDSDRSHQHQQQKQQHPTVVLKETNATELILLLLISNQNELPIYYELVKPTLELAAEYVNTRYQKFSIKIKPIKDSNTCEANVLGGIAAEEYYLGRVDGFIGPICNKAVAAIGRLASYWQVPIITAGGVGLEFSNKQRYRSLTRISFSLDRVGEFFSKIIQDYEWHHLAFIVDESDLLSLATRSSFEKCFKDLQQRENYFINLDIQEFDGNKLINSVEEESALYDKILLQAKKVSRVFILVMGGELARNFLLHAYDLGMNNGEYAFFGIELVRKTGESNDFSWYKPGDNKNNRKAKQIYESFMSLAVRVPTSAEYNVFVSKVMEKVMEDTGENGDITNVNPMVAAFYDAVVMYAWGYNKSLYFTENTDQQMTLSEKIKKVLWNNIFPDGLTGDIVLNENGDREVDYTLSDFNTETGIMQPVMTYFGRRRVIEKMHGVQVHWPNNGNAPLDVPYCGFNGDALQCTNQEIMPLWAILLFSLIILSLTAAIVTIFALRYIRAEKDLNSNWWEVNYAEIDFPRFKGGAKSSLSLQTTSDDGRDTLYSRNSSSVFRCTSTKMSADTSLVSAAGQLDSVLVGIYKGTRIAFKPMTVKRVVRNRKLLQELRMMRDLTHENLVRFIGACLEEPNIGVLTELMIRGSLRDVLDADKMEIDWTFRYSMISDIVEGMIFIHNSAIQYHGKLKSTNCLIDGRFMVKIGDYGTRQLTMQVLRDKESTKLSPKGLLWTAPEHLRAEDPWNSGSKKGDVYSFAIILQEIITRNWPYEQTGTNKQILDPSEIVDRVRMGIVPPFRPEIVSPDCPNKLMKAIQMCWSEDPAMRPDFTAIKPAMRRISNGVSSANFLENLLNRMEQYSSNLERIVEEKTQSVAGEKEKIENLLYQILPRYIANELKSGRSIAPELFESVSIAFSDIVGFTTLSSKSTPMQVVSLLNSLYSKFDELINTFDAYKMETIGDAYMIVSGMPVRNGHEHAVELAKCATEMMNTVQNFKIAHLPSAKLQLRIGIHSGPVVAGVVGNKMPKYLAFGDTVELASKMENTSQPMKIHITESSKKILDKFSQFNTAEQGEIELQNGKKMKTYFLEISAESK